MIRLAFPQLTEERRKELIKQIHKYARGRQGGHPQHPPGRHGQLQEAMEKKSEITEDELKQAGEGPAEADRRAAASSWTSCIAKKEKELMAV